MTDREPDFQLTGDDPMLGQIEAATAPARERAAAEPPAAPAGPLEPGQADAPPDPLEPGEPESARFEPDASQ